ncbi:MAG: hypothetical protein H0U85_04385 [Gemmatimonadales bacterium]|nr:hypothetical protein [Gemmatimonadales bacterium]
MAESLLLSAVAGIALAVWLLQRSRRGRARAHREDVDHAELEAAEREVRDLESGTAPEDGFSGDDWGPGAGGHRT